MVPGQWIFFSLSVTMHTSNQLASMGEYAAALLFRRKIAGVHRFTATFLGEKAQLLDYLVNLLDANGHEYGPFFFLQVKTTAAIARPGRGIRAKFSAREVRLVQARKVPVYLAAVMSLSDGQEEIYVMGIDVAQRGGVSVVPRLFPLSDDGVRMAIYREVNAYFCSGLQAFESGLTRRRAREAI